jgi:small redox-active disulfide protein 2
MNIKILGGGCANCKVLHRNVVKACTELEIDAIIEKVEDYEEIVAYGVMTTPALVIDEKVVMFGKLTYKQVLEVIKNE